MGAAFYTPGTRKIRRVLHTAFGPGPNQIKKTADDWIFLFDPARGVRIPDALGAMDLPPRNDTTFGSRLQKRFQQLFDAMLAADAQDNTTTHDEIRKATFDALTDAKASSSASVKPIKFFVAHQNNQPPYSPQNPRFRFVNWMEEDDNGKGAYNFLLICPELPGPIAARLRKTIKKKRKAKKSSKKKATEQ
jgi:hypothetical protein